MAYVALDMDGNGASVMAYVTLGMDALDDFSDDDLLEALRNRGVKVMVEEDATTEEPNWQHMRTIRNLLKAKEPPTQNDWDEIKYLLTEYVLPAE